VYGSYFASCMNVIFNELRQTKRQTESNKITNHAALWVAKYSKYTHLHPTNRL